MRVQVHPKPLPKPGTIKCLKVTRLPMVGVEVVAVVVVLVVVVVVAVVVAMPVKHARDCTSHAALGSLANLLRKSQLSTMRSQFLPRGRY